HFLPLAPQTGDQRTGRERAFTRGDSTQRNRLGPALGARRRRGMADAEAIQSVAKELRTAEEQRSPVAPVAARFGALTVGDAYAVQQANVERKLAGGDRIVGHKIGLTSLAMQTQLGVDQPDFGHLLASMAVPNGGAVATAQPSAPR